MKAYFRQKLQGNLKDKKVMFDEKDVDVVADVTQKSITVRAVLFPCYDYQQPCVKQ